MSASRSGAGASAAARAKQLHAAGRRRRLIIRGALAVLAAVVGWLLAGWIAAVLLAAVAVLADTVRIARRFDDAAAWRKGAVGERRTGRLLRPLETQGYVVLHDRALPGSRANADHLVIGPHGVLVVDTKNWAKHTRLTGGLAGGFGAGRRGQVFINGRPAAQRLGGILHERRVIARALERCLDRPVDVTALVVIHGARRIRWGALTIEGVTLISARAARRWIRSLPATYDPAAAAAFADTCDQLFPPYHAT